MLVYDMTSMKSFEAIEFWVNEFITQSGVIDPQTFPFVIVGNKNDTSSSQRQVTMEKVEEWRQKKKIFSKYDMF